MVLLLVCDQVKSVVDIGAEKERFRKLAHRWLHLAPLWSAIDRKNSSNLVLDDFQGVARQHFIV